MGYRVEYQSVRKIRGAEKRFSGRAALTAVIFLIFLLLVGVFWPKGAEALREVLIPGDAAVTAAALEDFAAELKAGQGMDASLENFCRQVIRGAELDFG